VVADAGSPSGYTLRARPRLASEDRNAYLSLSANLAAGAAMHRAGLGLFRTMPEPDSRHLRSLRRSAAALGIAWPDGATLRQVHAGLDQSNPGHVAFLLAA
jgi:exoribonuclease R